MSHPKRSTLALLLESAYCVLALLGILYSMGYAKGEFYSDFYIWYTNLSNYACMIIMGLTLYQTVKDPQKEHRITAQLRFLCVIGILITFFVYHILLTDGMSAEE